MLTPWKRHWAQDRYPRWTARWFLTVPPGTRSGRLRLRGRGLANGTSAGDLYAVV
jgi:hypothetical protein